MRSRRSGGTARRRRLRATAAVFGNKEPQQQGAEGLLGCGPGTAARAGLGNGASEASEVAARTQALNRLRFTARSLRDACRSVNREVKVIGYLRVSTDEQADSGLGLAAQRNAITAAAQARGWQVRWMEDAGYSAKNLDRPGVQAALSALAKGDADALVVAKLDRLSRSLLDFAGVTEQAKKQGWAVMALDLGVDMTTPAGEMLANVLAAFAQYERALISRRTKDALAAARARGQRLGRPREIHANQLARVVNERARGLSLRAIATALTTTACPPCAVAAAGTPPRFAASCRAPRWTTVTPRRTSRPRQESRSPDGQYREVGRQPLPRSLA